MLLRPKNSCVALSILGVYTHLRQGSSPTRATNKSRFESRFETSSSSASLQCTHMGWGSVTSRQCVHHKADTALVCRKFSGKSYTSHTVVRPVVVASVCSAPMQGGAVSLAFSVCIISVCTKVGVGTSWQCTHGGWGSATGSQCVHHKADTVLVCRNFSGKS